MFRMVNKVNMKESNVKFELKNRGAEANETEFRIFDEKID